MSPRIKGEQFFPEKQEDRGDESLYTSINRSALLLKSFDVQSPEYQVQKDKLFNLYEPIFGKAVTEYLKKHQTVGREYLGMDKDDFLQDVRSFFYGRVDEWIKRWDPSKGMFSLYTRKHIKFRMGDAGNPLVGSRSLVRHKLHDVTKRGAESYDAVISRFVSVDNKLPDDNQGGTYLDRIVSQGGDEVLAEQERRDTAEHLLKEYAQRLGILSSQSRCIVQNVVEHGMKLKEAGVKSPKPVSEARASQILTSFCDGLFERSRVMNELGISVKDASTRLKIGLLQRAHEIKSAYQEKNK